MSSNFMIKGMHTLIIPSHNCTFVLINFYFLFFFLRTSQLSAIQFDLTALDAISFKNFSLV